jgi:4-amino-4-deoxy-L-arabinose transferase-like glycosyltransferase
MVAGYLFSCDSTPSDHRGIIPGVLTTGAATRLPRRWWLGAICAFLVLAAALAAYVEVTPIGEQSDEYAHLNYAELISRHLALPTDGIQERQQPPLYYAMVAGVLKLTGDNLRAARWVSVALVLITAVLLVVTLRLLMPRRPWVALAGLWIFTLLPSVQYEGAQVSNDGLAWVAGAAVLLMLVITLRHPDLSVKHCTLVGAVVGLAIMAKATVWPLAALLVVALLVHHRRRLRLEQLAAVLIPIAAISGWWFVRNLSTYHRPLPPMTPITTSAEHTVRSLHQLVSWVSLSWKSTVGVEGPQQTPLVVGPGRTGLYLLTAAGIVVAAAVLLAVLGAVRSWRGRWSRPAMWLLAAPLLTVAFSLVNSITLDDQPQARYLLVAATVWCGGTAWAFGRLLGRRPALLTLLAAVALAGMLILDAASVQTVRLIT